MKNITRRVVILGGLLAALTASHGQELAEAYPSRTIKLLLPYPAGGPTDTVGRLVGQKLSEVMGKPVIVENRGGAGGVIGVTAAARSPALPDIPTFAESGLQDYDATTFKGFLVSSATPEPVIRKLNAALVRVLQMSDVADRLSFDGSAASPSTPEHFGALIRSEQKKWSQIIKVS